MSDKISQSHLDRKAILYVRQSSTHQVLHNKESRRLQYAMEQRLQGFGWKEVELIDEDLGRSAAGTVERTGFQRMVAEVCLGQVGAVAAREVSRFARNSRDWQHLIEVCGVVDTLLVDLDTVYDPRRGNDRLLLGLKGSLSEYELDLLRQRSVEARYQKARRGELVVTAPIGYVKGEGKRLEKDPDLRVQQALELIYKKFFELGSARQALMWFIEEELEVPVTHPGPSGWHTVWKRPSYRSIIGVLSNPVYAGAYVYGRVEVKRFFSDGRVRKVYKRKPRGEYSVLIKDHHSGYITWEQFERVEEILTNNDQAFRATTNGAPRIGLGLLAGLIRCRRCGRKISVRYSGGKKKAVRYVCNRGLLDQGEEKCISFGGVSADDVVVSEVLRAVRPGAIEAAELAARQVEEKGNEILASLRLELEATRYESDRAQRQFDASDPANRLVTAELERRWNGALEKVRGIERRVDEFLIHQVEERRPDIGAFRNLAEDLHAVWNDPATDVRIKKRIIRTLIEEVVADIETEADEVILIIHWKGGQHSELRFARKKRGHCRAHTSPEIIEAVRSLSLILGDMAIAGFLNRNRLRTGRGNRFGRELVASLRNWHDIPAFSPDRKSAEGWMTLTEAAKYVGVTPKTLRRAVERGNVQATHPLPDGPWILRRSDLDAAAGQIQPSESGARHPAGPEPGQLTLDLSTT